MVEPWNAGWGPGKAGFWDGALSLSGRDKSPGEILNAMVSWTATEWFRIEQGPGVLSLAP